jgi:predicted CXXCH cytochrome family protein
MLLFADVHTIAHEMNIEKTVHALAALLPALFLCVNPSLAGAVEHPGVFENDAQCSRCHSEKMRGRSVHSAMSSPCTVCHITERQGDMMMVSLSLPKARICFACHEETAALRQHAPKIKGQCLECHDAHSSGSAMLLRSVNPVKHRQACASNSHLRPPDNDLCR